MKTFLDGRVTLWGGDCAEVIKSIPDNSIDSVCTDPPYSLVSITKRFGKEGAAPVKPGSVYARASSGFMNATWDVGEVAFSTDFWSEIYRVLKPGGHVAAFGGTRSYHRLACAIEDAGFEIRDQLAWCYGTGFPKSHDVSKGIDKLDAVDVRRDRNLSFTEWMRSTGLSSATLDSLTSSNMGGHYTTKASQPAVATRAHFEFIRPVLSVAVPTWVEALIDEREVESENYKSREITGSDTKARSTSGNSALPTVGGETVYKSWDITAPATASARQWEGWGTALKPAWEPICLARKPLSEKTVAANVLRWGTGAINVDATRIPTNGEKIAPRGSMDAQTDENEGWARPWMADKSKSDDRLARAIDKAESLGRFPANLCHDGSDEVLAAFPMTGASVASNRGARTAMFSDKLLPDGGVRGHSDNGGSAARFFYSAKASKADRALSKHPTVKPVKLMQWLVRLITPPGGVTLDPFSGTGTTGEAAWREGFSAVLIEREEEYQADIERRMLFAKARPKAEPKRAAAEPEKLPLPLESEAAYQATMAAE